MATTILKLKTADCIARICNEYKGQDGYLTNPKNWKRVSKKGNSKKGYLREFRNKEDDEIRIFVKSSECEITSVNRQRTPFNILDNTTNKEQCSSDNLYTLIRKILEEGGSRGEEDYIDNDTIIYGLTFENLPETDISDDRDGFNMEEVDFENYEILEITPFSITISAGGDWQDPTTFTAIYDNGVMKVMEHTPTGDNWRDGLELPQIIERIYGNRSPQELNRFQKRNGNGSWYV